MNVLTSQKTEKKKKKLAVHSREFRPANRSPPPSRPVENAKLRLPRWSRFVPRGNWIRRPTTIIYDNLNTREYPNAYTRGMRNYIIVRR